MGRAGLVEKPRYGEPCNGCGMCCIAVQCPVSTALFGEQELCPALEQAGIALACGLMRNTADYVPDLPAWGGKALTEVFSLMIGSGLGCDGADENDSEERQEAFRPILHSRARQAIAAASPDARELLAYFQAPDQQAQP